MAVHVVFCFFVLLFTTIVASQTQGVSGQETCKSDKELCLTSEQQILLRSFKHWVSLPEESTTRERVDLFEIWQRTNPDAAATRAWYDAWAPTYDIDMMGSDYVNPRFVAGEVVRLNFAKDVRILDVGAGTGQGGLDLKTYGYTNIDATDGSPGMLGTASKTGAYRNSVECLVPTDGSPLCDIADGTYDLVVSSGSFYPYHLQGAHLRSIVSTVKVGGTLILSACPHNDQHVGLRTAIRQLEADGIVQVRKEEYIENWFDGEDGTGWTLKRSG